MFYFHEILKKKGKFGIIWLAATAPKRINRRDIYGVDVVRSSNDIIEVLTQYPHMAGKRVRFSLYLSSQLTFGLISVNNLKSSLLLEEIRTLAARMRSFRHELSTSIDLTDPVSAFRVTCDDPDFENPPFNFGLFKMFDDYDDSSVILPTHGYFVVSTPRSPEQEESRAPDVGDEITARIEDITMQEESPIPPEERAQDAQEDLVVDFSEPYPLEIDSVERPIESEVLEREPVVAIAQPEVLPDRAIDVAAPEREEIVEEQSLPPPPEPEYMQLVVGEQEVQDRVPEVPVNGQDVAELRGTHDQRPRQRDHTISPSPSPEHDGRRPRQRSLSVSERSFVLDPAPAGDRRRRRRQRHLLIDTETEFSHDVLKHNMETSDELLRPLILHNLQETAVSMLSRFGLRTAAHGSRRLWPNPQTLPEPNDTARFGFFLEETIAVVSDMPIQLDSDQLRGESREEPRAEDTGDESREDTHVDLSGRPSRVSHISRTLQESRDRDQVSSLGISRMSSFQASDLLIPDLSGIRTGFDEYVEIQPEPEPEDVPHISISVPLRDGESDRRPELSVGAEPISITHRVSEAEPILIPRTDTEPEGESTAIAGTSAEPDKGPEQPSEPEAACVVPPPFERTPPPPSPSLPRSPLLDCAMRYIIEAINESIEPNVTTFTSIVNKTPKIRVYVAKLFSLLLTLHEYGAIQVQQTFPMGEIFIFRGPRFEEYYPE